MSSSRSLTPTSTSATPSSSASAPTNTTENTDKIRRIPTLFLLSLRALADNKVDPFPSPSPSSDKASSSSNTSGKTKKQTKNKKFDLLTSPMFKSLCLNRVIYTYSYYSPSSKISSSKYLELTLPLTSHVISPLFFNITDLQSPFIMTGSREGLNQIEVMSNFDGNNEKGESKAKNKNSKKKNTPDEPVSVLLNQYQLDKYANLSFYTPQPNQQDLPQQSISSTSSSTSPLPPPPLPMHTSQVKTILPTAPPRPIITSNRATEVLQMFINVNQVEFGGCRDYVFYGGFLDAFFLGVNNGVVSDGDGVVGKKRKSTSAATSQTNSLSLTNCTLLTTKTFSSLSLSPLSSHLQILDLSGCYSLTSQILVDNLLPSLPNVKRLSLKNCRRITDDCLKHITKHVKQLQCLDLGGCYNLSPAGIIKMLQTPTVYANVNEIHVSGIPWDDITVVKMLSLLNCKRMVGLSLGFSEGVSGEGMVSALGLLAPDSASSDQSSQPSITRKIPSPLTSLSLHFNPTSITPALLQYIGYSFINLAALDVRGCSLVTSLAGVLKGRVRGFDEYLSTSSKVSNTDNLKGEDLKIKKLLILPRYCGCEFKDKDLDDVKGFIGMFEILLV